MQPNQKKTKTRRKAGQSLALDVAICSALRVENARQGERILMHYWLQKRRNEARALFEEIDAQIKNLEREINDAKKMASELKPNTQGQGRRAPDAAEVADDSRRSL